LAIGYRLLAIREAHAKLWLTMIIRKTLGAVLVLPLLCCSVRAEEFLPLPEKGAVLLAAVGDGVQIYESKPNPAGGFQWSLKAPDADLKNLSGEIIGKHGAGPSWTLNDGSSIVGSLPALKNVPASNSVPWLLLSVKTKSGSGLLEKADYVMRVATEGGSAPTTPPKTDNETVRVKYHAIYLFLKAS
jgi:Protein of unknown function (DUF3455)